MKITQSHRRRPLVVIGSAAIVIIGGLLSACDSSQSASSPTSGGILTVANNADALPNFVLAGRQHNFPWAANVFETLASYDENGEPQPLLATEWEVAADGLSVDFTLRDDVTFHSGRALTAEDVKFSYETAVDPTFGSQVAFIGESFAAIDVVSDTELTITFSRPLPNVFDFVEQTFIIDRETVEGLEDGSSVNGTGPFKWDSWDPGTGYTLVRNDDYWGDEPHLDEIDVAVINDSTAMVNAIRSERAQFAIGLSGIDVAGFQDDPQYEVLEATGALYPFGMNVDVAPFDDIEVRRAINYAIDRQRIADQVFGGLAQPTTQFWDPGAPGYDESLDDAYAYDPERAEEMLADAGAAGASFEINVIGFEPNVGAAEIVRNNLEEVGLVPTVNVVDRNDFGPRQNASDLGDAFMPLHGLSGYGPATLIDRVPALRGNNPSHFDSDEYQALRAALLSADPAEAADATQALAEYITGQAFSLPVVYTPGLVVSDPNLEEERITSRGYADFKAAHLSE